MFAKNKQMSGSFKKLISLFEGVFNLLKLHIEWLTGECILEPPIVLLNFNQLNLHLIGRRRD